jgi:hypothetical protein
MRLVGTMPDAELARRLGRRYQSVVRVRYSLGRPVLRGPRRKGWKPHQVAWLGVLPDQETAHRVGRSLESVGARRRVKGVPPPPPATKRWSWREDDLLGSMPDAI